ncbi:histidinol-phosphate transaminase [Pararobbsia silviterrae]|uniref:Histidinol-phosphate aminotransferase n=1 Tax=Pararobbsia silviterrae TaxID=1792498 RepID=A0A494Y8V3_9BURK|nr:histidinol-phosphate transaminase [Pararobbsia silviterrae]RKP58826.1 histidinol-phosphate transaminase [Pararobbsia silviterrae]
MSRFWSDIVHRLSPYTPGEQPAVAHPVKLNTNENPYGPSPRVLAALSAELGGQADTLRRYPDPTSRALHEAIAQRMGVHTEQVFVGNGSDEVLAHIFQGLLRHAEPILFPDVTYSFYPTYARLFEVQFTTIALESDFSIDVDAYRRPNGGILIANPNAPTGRALTLAQIERLLVANPDSVVVIDEAYVDFGAESAIALIDRFPQLLVVQTLSKSRSLAGLRVGFAIGHRDLIEALTRVKDSFNSYPIDRLAQVGAVAALDDVEWFDKTRHAVIATRETLTADLQALGFEVLPSAANFVFARHPDEDAAALAQALREREIFVRHFRLPRIEQFLRISVGTDAECKALIDALKTLVKVAS